MNWKIWQSIAKRGSRLIKTKVVIAVAAVYLLTTLFLQWWWDFEPEPTDVRSLTEKRALEREERIVTGSATTITVLHLTETLLDKRGGFLSNDIFPPSVWMDNVPNWEFGVLVQLRDISRAMRIDFSRSQSQSSEDPDLGEAEGKFFYDSTSWIFPESEDEYRDGIEYVSSYLDRLSDTSQPDAQFYARTDSLSNWLEGVGTRLGNLSQRLSESVGKEQINLALAGDSTAISANEEATEEYRKTSWTKTDDVFYEARGQTWALLHLLRAVEIDFAPALDDKNARASLRQIIQDLEAAQAPLRSPVVLSGSGFGILANHSLVLASYIARVNAAIIDLRVLLLRG